MTEANTAAASLVVDRCVVDVVASLRHKHVHCIDEQRHIQRHHYIQDFARWFEQLVVTPDFVASVDNWT